MRKLILLFFITSFFVSCTKEEQLPPEVNLITGKWKAYKYIEYFNTGTPQNTSVTHSTAELGIEYSLVIKHAKIEIYNSKTLSTIFKIKTVELIIPDSPVIINFLFSGYSARNIEQKQFLIVYDKSKDEIIIQSGYFDSNNSTSLDLSSYKMTREN